MVSQERVVEILKETHVLQEGHFMFTSGRHSNTYMQCARILEYPEYTMELSSVLAEAFKDDGIDVVIGPAAGGIILSYEVARQLGVRNLFTERENGRMILRRGFNIPKGSRVLIVEDVISTGGSVREVMDIVNVEGGQVVGVGVFIDRTNGRIDFGCKLESVYSTDLISYDPEDCPICQEGIIPIIKPGSRNL